MERGGKQKEKEKRRKGGREGRGGEKGKRGKEGGRMAGERRGREGRTGTELQEILPWPQVPFNFILFLNIKDHINITNPYSSLKDYDQ